MHLIDEGAASTAELDAAITCGPGLRWAFMGTCLAFHLAGGDVGMRDFMRQFGPALELPWTKLVAPQLADALIEKVAQGTEHQAAGRAVQKLERQRDQYLIAILKVPRRYAAGAGQTLAAHQAQLQAAAAKEG